MKRKVLNNSYSFIQKVNISSCFFLFPILNSGKKIGNPLERTGINHSKALFLNAMTSQINF